MNLHIKILHLIPLQKWYLKVFQQDDMSV